MQLNKMTEYTVLPAYVYAPSYKHFAKVLKVRTCSWQPVHAVEYIHNHRVP